MQDVLIVQRPLTCQNIKYFFIFLMLWPLTVFTPLKKSIYWLLFCQHIKLKKKITLMTFKHFKKCSHCLVQNSFGNSLCLNELKIWIPWLERSQVRRLHPYPLPPLHVSVKCPFCECVSESLMSGVLRKRQHLGPFNYFYWFWTQGAKPLVSETANG